MESLVLLYKAAPILLISLAFDMAKRYVAAYCRVSTLEQKKKGLGMKVQIRDVKAFADGQNLVIDRFYPDEAQSGAAENRKELGKLLRACKRGEIRIVIIPAIDRLSRNVRLAENLFHEFQQDGVEVLIADMPTYNNRNRRDVLLRQIREAIAEENRGEIVERLFKARQERVRTGNVPGGNVPYGFQRHEKRWIRHDEECEIVRLIFGLFEDGTSPATISVTLNERGFTRRNGQPWIPRQIYEVLSRRNLYEKGAINYGTIDGANETLVLLETQSSESEDS